LQNNRPLSQKRQPVRPRLVDDHTSSRLNGKSDGKDEKANASETSKREPKLRISCCPLFSLYFSDEVVCFVAEAPDVHGNGAENDERARKHLHL
jgi:hypothetical protein